MNTDPTKVLYIGGFGRSGSTLVERVLGQLPGFCSAGEVVFIWQRALAENQLCGCGEPFAACQFWQRVGKAAFDGWDQLDAAEMIALARMVDRNRYIPSMVVPALRPGARAAMERYAGVLSRLYQGIAEVSGARVVIDASKHASTAFLLRRVPDVSPRFVHLVRDSRGVAYSWTKQVRKPEVAGGEDYMPVYRPPRSAGRWMSYNLMFDVLGAVDDTLVLRYEQVLSDPRGTLARILAHAGEPASPDALGFLGDGWVDLGVDHTVAGNPMRFHTGRLDLRMDDAWKTELAERDARIVSALTAPLLLRYGYRQKEKI